MKTILITGATDGLGKALALQCIDKYQLILCGRNHDKMKSLLAQLPKERILYSECFDLLDSQAIQNFLNNCANFKIDVLINNAGANIQKDKVEDLNLQHFQEMMQLNCISGLQIIQGIYPQMKTRQSGHIINILSSVCKFNNETTASYTASKMAMQAVSDILRKESRCDKIKVTNVYPGGINTNFRAVTNPSYLTAETVAQAIIQCLELPQEAHLHELVIRPQSESNF